MKQAEAYIKITEDHLTNEERNNITFYVAMYIALMKLGFSTYRAEEVASIDLDSITPDLLFNCAVAVTFVFDKLEKETYRFLDVIAKQPVTTEEVIKHFEEARKNKT